jgi:hypothetical protein
MYFDQTVNGDWLIESSKTSEAAFKAGIEGSDILAGTYENLAPGKIPV